MTGPGPLRRSPAQTADALRQFGREWLLSPGRVGAIAPSSAALARAMCDGLTAADAPVIELGPGTGVFTSALVAQGIPPDRIAAIEASEGFADALAHRLPGVSVIRGDAARVRHLSPFGDEGAGVVVCGLPLLSIPPAKVLRILAGSLAALRPGGEIRLFTYGPRCPVAPPLLARLGLVARRSAFVALNMPPASVYTLRRAV